MKDDIQKTALRLPRELHKAIHEAARLSGRTMNAEIVYRLQQTFDEEAVDIPAGQMRVTEGLGAGERSYLLEVERLGAKLDQILKKLEEK